MGADAPTNPAVIDTDLPCAACGYNLRTQPREGRCPECAATVAAAIAAALARRVDYRRVLAGAALLLACWLLPFLVRLVPWLLHLNWGPDFDGHVGYWVFTSIQSVLVGCGELCAVVLLATVRPPAERGFWCRAAIFLATATLLMETAEGAIQVWYFSQPAMTRAPQGWWGLFTPISIAAGLATAVLLVLGAVFVARLRARGKRWRVATLAAVLTLPAFAQNAFWLVRSAMVFAIYLGAPLWRFQDLITQAYLRATLFISIAQWLCNLALWTGVAIAAWRQLRRARHE